SSLSSLARKGSPRGMIRAVYLAVAVDAASVESEDVESGDGRMARQHIDVALLAQLVAALREQRDIVGAMRGVAGHAILLDWLMLPQEWTALLRVALITGLIDREAHEHSAPLTPVRIVAGDAIDFHHIVLCAEQMCRALVLCLSYIFVAAET